jgi:hypothetical protein
MSEEPKILEKGESTFRNGGGSLCGGVMSKTEFFKGDIWGNMMAYYMEDDKFEIYKKLKSSKGIADQKSAKEWFDKYAMSFI